MADTLDTSIVVPVHGEAAMTRRCLDDLLQDYGEHVELVVVDDGSTDSTPRLLEAYADRVRVVRHDVNRGFAAACNSGARAATRERLLFLNNDTIGRPGWLEAMVAAAEEHPEVGAIGAKLLYSDATVQHAGIVFGQERLPYHAFAGFAADHKAVSRSRRFRAVTGACMLVARDTFHTVGGFDESYVNCYEDVDFCLRLDAAGLGSWLCHEAVLHHLESRTRDARAGLEESERRFRERWGSVRQDDMDHYLEDGLVTVQRGPTSVIVGVAPELGQARAGVEGIDVERTLAQRAAQVVELRAERDRLERLLLKRTPGSAGYRSDGSCLVLDDGDVDAVIAVERGELLRLLEDKLRPLRLSLVSTAPVRVNVLVSELRSRIVFGGYAAVFQLSRRLAERGVQVRLLTLDGRPERDQELAALLPGVEVEDASDRSAPLAVSRHDAFVAMSVWGAHVAHAATRQLGGSRFVFLIQDDETLFYPSGSFAAGARAAYELPHAAVFSTEFLRDWFRAQGRGVFGPGPAAGQGDIVFRNAIVDAGAPHAEGLAQRSTRRLLLYARPGSTEARNVCEVASLALRRAVQEGVFGEGWEFTGIGGEEGELPLHGETKLRLVPRQSPMRYRAVLQAHDLGVSLMDSPHPSLVPLEMAAAGMPTVTSTFANKDASALSALSPNLIGVTPTIEGVLEGLRRAVLCVDDVAERVAGAARLQWPRSAEQAFDSATLDRVEALVDGARAL